METRRVHEVVHTLRQKPVHVRERIALGVAGGVTAIVAVGWFAANSIAGTFSLAPTTLAGGNPDVHQAVAQTSTSFSELVAASGAAFGAGSSSPATITVVDTKVNSTLDQQEVPADQTVIHF
jgi:hypothetical protein